MIPLGICNEVHWIYGWQNALIFRKKSVLWLSRCSTYLIFLKVFYYTMVFDLKDCSIYYHTINLLHLLFTQYLTKIKRKHYGRIANYILSWSNEYTMKYTSELFNGIPIYPGAYYPTLTLCWARSDRTCIA